MKSERLYLIDMLDTARRIQRMAEGLLREEFDQDEKLQLALTHLIQIVGEAARHITPETRTQFPSVAWRSITGMRHRLVHDYGYVNLEVIWSVSTVRIPELIIDLAPLVDPIIDQERKQLQEEQ